MVIGRLAYYGAARGGSRCRQKMRVMMRRLMAGPLLDRRWRSALMICRYPLAEALSLLLIVNSRRTN